MNLNQNIIKKTYLFFISFLFIFFSCNSDDDNKGVTPTDKKKDVVVAATGVTLDKEELPLEVGAKSTLVATVTPTTATNKGVSWASDKPDIATVTKNGLVTAVAVGTATITVATSADDTKKDTVTVTVTSTLTFSIADVSITSGTTSFDISPTLTPTEATADYELTTKPIGVTMEGTTINIAADMADGEYEITVKAKETGDFTRETEATFTLYLGTPPKDDFIINFRDEKFKEAVKSDLEITANDVTYGDVKNRTELTVIGKSITNMEEIRFFTDLKGLNCQENQLTSLDISHNTALEKLHCKNNKLTSLDISQNTNLKILDCKENQLTSLDISQNTALEYLYCSKNKLASLNLNHNIALEKLHCSDNKLTSLDISKNTVLEYLDCHKNKLASLNLNQNIVLEYLDCSNNQLTSLGLNQNTVLEKLHCSNNQLTSLGLDQNTDLTELFCSNNQLTSLDLSKNTKFVFLYHMGNPLVSLDVRGMREVGQLNFINKATLQELKVHKNIMDTVHVMVFKMFNSTVTISTYNAPEGSTVYEPMCNDYAPSMMVGGGSCND